MCVCVCIYVYISPLDVTTKCRCQLICMFSIKWCYFQSRVYFSFFQTFNSIHVYTYNSIHIQIMQKNTRTSRAAVDPQHLKVEILE